MEKFETTSILGVRLHALSWDDLLETLDSWAAQHEPRYVCLCNVHSVVTAYKNSAFLAVVNQADLAIPDGAPIAWAMRRIGYPEQGRIAGPDLMWRYCYLASTRAVPVFLLGGTIESLDLLLHNLKTFFPAINIAGALSPPFRDLTAEENLRIITAINTSGAGVVFVGLGCPKQETWMASHYRDIKAVMIGVGAAFDIHAGVTKRAPLWMRQAALEWLFRLLTDPVRLWRRYLTTNLTYILRVALPLLLRKGKDSVR